MDQCHMAACFKIQNIPQRNLQLLPLHIDPVLLRGSFKDGCAAADGIHEILMVIGLLQIIQGIYIIAVHGMLHRACRKNQSALIMLLTQCMRHTHTIRIIHIDIQKDK